MESPAAGNKLHPILWVAAVAVILLSAAGIGAIFGIIPGAGSSSKPAEPVAAAAPAQAPAAALPTPLQDAQTAPEPKAGETEKHKPVHAPKPAAKTTLEPAAPPMAQTPSQPVLAPTPPPPPPCRNCGTVEAIREIQLKGEGTGLGAVAGGVGGAIIGSQIGRGHGRDAATVLGAVGGAVAGHEIEKNARKTVKYDIVVRYEDGTSQSFRQDAQPAWRPGDKVRVENNVIMAR